MAEQEDNTGQNRLEALLLEQIACLRENPRMVKVPCPRCNQPMRWNGRLKIFICDVDGFMLGPNDPYVKRVEYEPSANPEASPRH